MAKKPAAYDQSLYGSRTDVGMVRAQNEDSLIVKPPLYVVCDGMGGHEAGEVASEIAVNVIADRAPDYADATALGQAVEEANLAIMQAARDGRGRLGMGTTCTAAMIEGERLVLAQVGDSRAYILHNGILQQVTRDHSLVANLVDSGQITPEEARVHPQRSMITRALGSDPTTQADLYELNAKAGDRLLLCSDGLYSMIEDFEIEDLLNEFSDPQEAADELVTAALNAGGSDNVTVIVVDITGYAEKRQRKMERKTKITAVTIVVLLVAIIVGAIVGFNYWVGNSAYLGEVDGRVAIYKGMPGDVVGLEFNDLDQVTEISVSDLEPGVANRIKNNEIACDSLESAYALVSEYRENIAKAADEEAASGGSGSGSSSAGSAAGSGSATGSSAAASSRATSNAGVRP